MKRPVLAGRDVGQKSWSVICRLRRGEDRTGVGIRSGSRAGRSDRVSGPPSEGGWAGGEGPRHGWESGGLLIVPKRPKGG